MFVKAVPVVTLFAFLHCLAFAHFHIQANVYITVGQGFLSFLRKNEKTADDVVKHTLLYTNIIILFL